MQKKKSKTVKKHQVVDFRCSAAIRTRFSFDFQFCFTRYNGDQLLRPVPHLLDVPSDMDRSRQLTTYYSNFYLNVSDWNSVEKLDDGPF